MSIEVIELWGVSHECWLCESDVDGRRCLMVYEDVVLPSDTEHEWGGQHVCNRCYELARLVTRDFTYPAMQHGLRETLKYLTAERAGGEG